MDDHIGVAREFMHTYVAGDSAGLLATLSKDWVVHDSDGSATDREGLAEITELHHAAFSEKAVEFFQELVDGDFVAHHVRFTLVHTGRYHDLEPTGRTVELSEMIFHRMHKGTIAESWRMTYPAGVYAALSART